MSNFTAAQTKAIKAAKITARENKSQAMRDLEAAGFSRGNIAKILDVRYQFVKNVLDRGAPKRDTQKAKISELEALVAKLQAEIDAETKAAKATK